MGVSSFIQTELKYLDSFKFYYVLTDLGVPSIGVGWVGAYGWKWEWKEVSHACAHTHIIGISQGFPNAMTINYLMYACACMHVHAHTPTHIHEPHPSLRGVLQISENNKILMNQNILILFEDF